MGAMMDWYNQASYKMNFPASGNHGKYRVEI
jgi:hypothetical protein